MKFLDWLLRRRPRSEQIEPAAEPTGHAVLTSGRFPRLTGADGGAPEVLTKVSKPASSPSAPTPPVVNPGQSAMNIWELDEEAAVAPPLRGDLPVAPARRRQNRLKTRMLGFETLNTHAVPLFEDELTEVPGDAAVQTGVVMFPTGWLIVTQGAGRGASFALSQGVSHIGRGPGQVVRLDFGDMSISRSHHAAIAYDASTHEFHLGHGGKSNLVRLNGKPLLSTERIVDGDEIQIGETTLLLKVLCTAEFNWSAAQAGGDGHDMAIA